MEKNVTVMTIPRARMMIGLAGLIITSILGLFYVPAYILEGFFIFQFAVQYIAYIRIRTESFFTEYLLAGPAKIATALFMLNADIPDNTFWGSIWAGLAITFALLGIRNLYIVHKINQTAYAHVTQPSATMTAKQAKKAKQEEDSLLADIAAYLEGDSSGKN